MFSDSVVLTLSQGPVQALGVSCGYGYVGDAAAAAMANTYTHKRTAVYIAVLAHMQETLTNSFTSSSSSVLLLKLNKQKRLHNPFCFPCDDELMIMLPGI